MSGRLPMLAFQPIIQSKYSSFDLLDHHSSSISFEPIHYSSGSGVTPPKKPKKDREDREEEDDPESDPGDEPGFLSMIWGGIKYVCGIQDDEEEPSSSSPPSSSASHSSPPVSSGHSGPPSSGPSLGKRPFDAPSEDHIAAAKKNNIEAAEFFKLAEEAGKVGNTKLKAEMLGKARKSLADGWGQLAANGDPYASACYKLFDTKNSLTQASVHGHWESMKGENFMEEFIPYGQQLQDHYFDLINKTLKEEAPRLPNTYELELNYQRTMKERGLPETLAIDLLLNTLDPKAKEKVFQKWSTNAILFGDFVVSGAKEWWHFVGVGHNDPSRISPERVTLSVTQEEAAKQVQKTILKTNKVFLRNFLLTHPEIMESAIRAAKDECGILDDLD